jgi:type IV fimbrial biogenesis protein FimT
MKAPKRGRGVTLVELVSTLATVAVIVTLGVPAFGALQADRQRNHVSSALTASFALARTEAVRRGVDVRLCPSADGATCATPAGGDWRAGWIVAATDGDTAQVIEFTRPSLRPACSIVVDTVLAAGVTFTSAGLPSVAGNLTYSDAMARSVFRLSPIGRLDRVP